METLEKGVFIVNFEHFTPFICVSIIDFEKVNISWANTRVHNYFTFSNILDNWVSQSDQKKKKTEKKVCVFDFVWEAVAQRCSVKKVFLEIWQNSQENICAKVKHVIFVIGRVFVYIELSNTM